MAIRAEGQMESQQTTSADYPKVETFAQDVQHHRPGEPVGSIPLSVSETDIPHHAGANPNAKPKGSEES
jgi:hypothetical protein